MFWGLFVFVVAKSVTCPMYKVWVKKIENFFFWFLCFKNDFKRVLDVFWGLLVFEVAKSVTWLMYKVWAKTNRFCAQHFCPLDILFRSDFFWIWYLWGSSCVSYNMEAYGSGVRAWGSMTDGGPCIRYGANKIENFFFVSYALKTILKGFRTCFEDFWFSRSPNPLHD